MTLFNFGGCVFCLICLTISAFCLFSVQMAVSTDNRAYARFLYDAMMFEALPYWSPAVAAAALISLAFLFVEVSISVGVGYGLSMMGL
jgi:hypothetical protein